jgi:DNA-binding NarL/FixJ family response regulator
MGAVAWAAEALARKRHCGRTGCGACWLVQWVGLTPRELDVFSLICLGAGERYIARVLRISQQMVKCHTFRVLNKTGMDTRLELFAWARARQLID